MENALNIKIMYELTELVKESNYLIDKQEKEITQLREALEFYADESKYHYTRKDHPNTRLAEDGGEVARKVLQN